MTNLPHPVETLFLRLRAFRYPDDVVATSDLVPGAEFFPGGCGLWHAEPGAPWPLVAHDCVMVLGHNLDSVDNYRRHVRTGGLQPPRPAPTWTNLRKLLLAAGVGLERCFLTNFFMGCGPNQIGSFPGARDPQFVSDCTDFLRETVTLLRPVALLVLGGHTRRYVASLSPKLAAWRSIQSFDELDIQQLGVVQGVEITGIDGAKPFGVANIMHPSGWTRGGNQSKRRFCGLAGMDAEVELVRRAVHAPDPTTQLPT